jgi:hypothetical protein
VGASNADFDGRLVKGRLAGFEVKERFCEIGSLKGSPSSSGWSALGMADDPGKRWRATAETS